MAKLNDISRILREGYLGIPLWKMPAVFMPRHWHGSDDLLLVITHMRSRSTVLSHVLASNPEIRGYRELHHGYWGQRHFALTRLAVRGDFPHKGNARYTLDKLNHAFFLKRDLLEANRSHLLFLLRPAYPTIRSIIEMGETTGVDWYRDPGQVVDYYCRCIEAMVALARDTNCPSIFVPSEALVRNSDESLAAITTWLGLSTALSTDYETFDKTGKAGHGDPSERIRSGKLAATAPKQNYDIPADLLARAEATHATVSAALAELCDVVVEEGSAA